MIDVKKAKETPAIRLVGIISTLLFFLTIVKNPEKQIAQPIGKIFPEKLVLVIPSFNIINIPVNAITIIQIVLNDILSLRKIAEKIKVRNGIELIVNKVFAIVVL